MSANDTKGQIVCPLSLMLAIASGGAGGAVQFFRCNQRGDGWETRPQKTDTRWAEDFVRVLHGERGTQVTLLAEAKPHKLVLNKDGKPALEETTTASGKPEMPGFGFSEDTKVFKFAQADGERAFQLAIGLIVGGYLKAPRNWDKAFAEAAGGISSAELKTKYADLYASNGGPRTSQTSSEPIEAIGEGFFLGEETPPVPETEAREEPQDLEEDAGGEIADLEEEPEEDFEITGYEDSEHIEEEEREPSYSVTAEATGEQFMTDSYVEDDGTRIFVVNYPDTPRTMRRVPDGVNVLELGDDGHGSPVTLYKVEDAEGTIHWLEEGQNSDLSGYAVTVNGLQHRH